MLLLVVLVVVAITFGGRLWLVVNHWFTPKVTIKLYMAAAGGGLKSEEKEIAAAHFTPEGLWEELILASRQEKISTIPPDTKLLAVQKEGGVLVLNLSHHLTRGESLGSTAEMARVYSIVNTMAQLQGVEAVQILIEGRTVESLAGHIDLTGPLTPDYSLVASE